MRRLLFGTLVLCACTESGSVELPSDAARPLHPAAAVAAQAEAVPPQSAAAPAPSLAETDPPALGAEVRATPAASVRRAVRPQLRGRGLAHKVYQARFGPSADTGQPTRVVLTRHVAQGQTRLAGFGLSDGVRYDFPPLHDAGALDRVAAVMFRNVDEDADRELIVLAVFEDPETQEPFFSNLVLDWSAASKRFERHDVAEGEIEALENATAVSRHLKRVGPLPSGAATP